MRLFIILLTLLTAGCGHLSDERGGNSSSQPNTPASELPSQTSTGPAATESSPSDQQGAPEQSPTQDLIARIRDGFELPPLRSKHTREYEKWNSTHPTYLKNLFQRAEPFLFHIVEQLEARDMPLDLALLPAVESAFKPKAYSRSSAAGLWQFIPSTGKHFGLRQDWWYDGRLDPIASTTAALDYLQELHAMFDGDWFLALAAYNAGQGTIQRAIKKHRKRQKVRYEDLNLRRETTHYVPKLFALRNIIADPQKFGVTLPVIPNRAYFTTLKLSGQTDLKRLARETGLDGEMLETLNAGYLRWASPPQGPHRLLVPVAAADRAIASIDRLAKEAPLSYQEHTIRRGETLSTIGRRYGVSIAAIQQTNNLRGSAIRAGHTLLIPIAARSGQANDARSQNPVVGRNSLAEDNAAVESSAGAVSARESAVRGATRISHRVVAGDTLWSIAQRYKVNIEELLSWNRLSRNQILNLDQVLTVFTN